MLNREDIQAKRDGGLATKSGSVRALAATVAFLLLTTLLLLFTSHSLAQKRITRRPGASRTSQTKAIDYSRFSHATSKHQASCNTCHKIPTRNWQKVRD